MRCPNCDTPMKKDVHWPGGCVSQWLCISMMVIGVGLALTCVGLVICWIPMVAGAMAGKRESVWKCPKCGNLEARK